jgi:hypothetical protein
MVEFILGLGLGFLIFALPVYSLKEKEPESDSIPCPTSSPIPSKEI